MSTDKVFSFFQRASQDPTLQEQLKAAKTPAEIVELLKQAGIDCGPEEVKQAIAKINAQPHVFSDLAEAVLKLFSPTQDHYPAVGVQPFSGDPNKD